MTNVTIGFDETVLAKAVVDQVVQAIQEEFHKIFPRLRRDEIEAATQPLTTDALGELAVHYLDTSKMTYDQSEKMIDAKRKEILENAKPFVRPITPAFLPATAYVIKNKVDPIIVPGNLTLEEGFWFISKEQDGSAKLTGYHVLETNNA